jgi:2,3-bisphosphoglycerate-dependent phosphoglycerate mutase
MSNLYLITHCESCYNKRKIFTGRIDSVLTKDGHKHAELISLKLKNKRIDLAYVSPLKRAKQTLKHILKYHPETKVIESLKIIERDYGELSGKGHEKYKREYPELYPLYHRSYEIAPPGGESMKQVEKRVVPFIRLIIGLMKERDINILVVAHSNSIRPIRKYFEKLSTDEMMKLENYRHKIFTYEIK